MCVIEQLTYHDFYAFSAEAIYAAVRSALALLLSMIYGGYHFFYVPLRI